MVVHAGGAIGPDGPATQVEIQLGNGLERLRLPEPPSGARLIAAIQASLAVLEVAPLPISAAVLGAAYRAPLCQVLSSPWRRR